MLLALVPSASASCPGCNSHEINFDDGAVKAGEVLRTQYTHAFGNAGVTFGTATQLGYPNGASCAQGPGSPPEIVAEPTIAYPGRTNAALTPNYAQPHSVRRPRSVFMSRLAEVLPNCPNTGPSGAMFSCTTACTAIDVTVGEPSGASFPSRSATATFYNASGELLDTETVSFKHTGAGNHLVYAGVGDVTYVAIGPPNLEPIAIGNLAFTVDPSAVPFFTIGLPSGTQSLRQGATLNVPIQINRFNGESGNVTIEVSGLPSGVSASVTPNPITGSGGSATLELTAEPSAAPSASLTPAKLTITAKSSEGTVAVPLSVSVDANFVLGEGPIGPWRLPPCTTVPEPIGIALVAGFTGTLNLSARYVDSEHHPVAGPSVTLSRSSIVASGIGEFQPFTVFINMGTRFVSRHDEIEVTATSGPMSQTVYYEPPLEQVGGRITSFSPGARVSTPQLGLPGTQVTLRGAGFCPGTKFAIGDPDFTATAESITSDGTSATFRVARRATTGPIHVLPPTGQGFDGPVVTVHSFRNTFGFSWKNGDYGLRLNGEMVDELFGQDETNIDISGWLIRKPEASLFEAMVNDKIPGGICFGIAFSSLEFHDFPSALASFPNSGGSIYYPGTDAWHLNSPGEAPPKGKPRGPGGPSDALLRYVTSRFSLQFTDQLIPAEVNAVLGIHGTNDDINTIKAELAGGEPVLIGLIRWNPFPEAHTVLAYDVHQLADGTTAVDVVNSNVPYMTSEENEPKAHDLAEFTESWIKLDEGNWEFPELGWSGSEADMVVYRHTELPIVNGKRPKLPSVFVAGPGALLLSFGSSGDGVTQLSDGHGSLLAGGKLAPRSSWPKGVAPLPAFTSQPRPLQMVTGDPGQVRPITATVDRGAGGGMMNINLPGLQASLKAGALAGQVDKVSVDPHNDTLGYQTSASSTSFTGTLLSAPGAAASARRHIAAAPQARAATMSSLSDRLVKFQVTSGRGGGEQVAFPSGRELVLRHAGAPTGVSLMLSAFAADGQPIAVRLPAVHLLSGETLRVAPLNWRSLGSSRVRVSITARGHTSLHTVHGRRMGRRFATVRRATLVSVGHGSYRIDLALGLRGVPRHGWLSAAATVLRRGRAIAQAKPTQLESLALKSGTVHLTLPTPLPAGRYALRIRLLESTADGPIQGSTVLTRTLPVRALSVVNGHVATGCCFANKGAYRPQRA